MPKFKAGDMVFFAPNKLEGTSTETVCGLSGPMKHALSKCEMEVIGGNGEYEGCVLLHSPLFGMYTNWWFHEDDLEFFNTSLENK